MNKYSMISIIIALATSSCAPSTVDLYYKVGTDFQDVQLARDECKMSSFGVIPQNMMVEQTPGYHDPGNLVCDGYGTFLACRRVGSFTVPGRTYTYDVNQGIRDRYVERCMADKGFALAEVKTCQKDQRGYDPADKAPPLSEISCVVYDPSTAVRN
jgi:hypothetical protein